MIVAKFNNSNMTIANGLTQWDYGQELAIENANLDITDGTEVDFYQGLLSHVGHISNRHIEIPDLMLQNANEIVAYVYVRTENSGETILSIQMPVRKRPRPADYVLPEYKEYRRLLPPGGEAKQVLVKRTEKDYDISWEDRNGDVTMEEMTDEEVDAIFEERRN